jgi:hypothetical protein
VPNLPQPITTARLAVAALLELLPIIAVAVLVVISLWSFYLVGNNGERTLAIALLLMGFIAFFGSGIGWFVAGVPAVGCWLLVIRGLLTIAVFATIPFAFSFCDRDAPGAQCETGQPIPLLIVIVLWTAGPVASAGLLWFTQRQRLLSRE